MATTSWLYELARAPVEHISKAGASGSKGSFLPIDTEWIVSNLPSVPDFSEEIDQLKNTTLTFLNETYVEIEERFHLNDRYSQVEHQVSELSCHVGLSHIPPTVLLQSFLCGVFCLVCLVVVGTKIYRRRRHQRLYGNNAFPPFARAGAWKTARLMNSSKLPWFFKECAESAKSSVFRIRVPFLKAPMFVAVGDLNAAKEILQDPTTLKSEALNASIASVAGGPNIFTSEGPQWKNSRKAVSPAFMKKYLDRMHQICKVETEEWINDKLKPCVEKGKDFDIGKELVLLTLSILCHAAFEYKIKPKEGEAVVQELNIVTRDCALGNSSSLRSNLGFFLPSVRRSEKARKRIQDFAKKMLQAYRKNNSKSDAALEETIIGCIARSTKYEDDSRRIADIVMFLLSGVDNTAYSLAWTLIELAKHPEEAANLKQALNGKDDFRAQEMLKDVLREGMRLCPPVPGIGIRTLGRDFYLEDKSMVIPKGSQVFFPSFILTRFDVEDAEVFRPSRWREHPDKSFLLFSTGRRNCIGQSLALAEITWVLSRLCAKYDFEVTEDGTAEFCGTLKCVGTRLIATPAYKPE
ncbi:cytochrome P450 [Nitzschia inconspicua]|uniref:Cytochrome P450 n=1 Tax=Nitzschia inconspicua TaxID=303405 RepID=A0A9K3PSV5_9STRA|nr:cytochrome P450 [Nitzschia inconspicua]